MVDESTLQPLVESSTLVYISAILAQHQAHDNEGSGSSCLARELKLALMGLHSVHVASTVSTSPLMWVHQCCNTRM